MPKTRSLLTFSSLAFLMGSSFAHANALQDLKSALERLDSNEPLTAVYEREFTEVSDADDEDDDVECEQPDVDGVAEAAEVSADDRAAGDLVAGPDEGDEEASD